MKQNLGVEGRLGVEKAGMIKQWGQLCGNILPFSLDSSITTAEIIEKNIYS
mgnify:CR=1 FL=1